MLHRANRLMLLCLALAAAAVPHAQVRTEPLLAFAHVNVIDGTGAPLKADQTVVVSGGNISAVGPAASTAVPADARVLDATGKFMIPGLWDLHVHTRYEGIDHLRLFIANGITGVRDMGGDWAHLDRIREWEQAIRSGQRVGPRIIPAGPLLDGPGSPWSHSHVVNGPEEGRDAVRQLKAKRVRFAKVYALLSRESFVAIVDEAKRQGLVVTGHLPRAVTAAEAVREGQRTIEHGTSLFLGTSRREEEFRQSAEKGAPVRQADIIASYDPQVAQRLYQTLKASATAVIPTLSLSAHNAAIAAGEPANADRLAYVPPPYVAAWRKEAAGSAPALKSALQHATTLVGQLYGAGVEVLPGTDVVKPFFVPGFTLHDELALLVRAGVPAMTVLEGATLGAARLAGEMQTGAIQAGKAADFVLLDANPLEQIDNTRKIAGVVAAGRLFDAAALKEMLDDMRREAALWSGTPTGR